MLLGDRGGVANVAWISGTTAWPPNVNATDPNAFITPNTRSAVDSPCDSSSPALAGAGAVAVAASSPPHLLARLPPTAIKQYPTLITPPNRLTHHKL